MHVLIIFAYKPTKDPMNTTPEHLHLALNHLPFLGSGMALIPILAGLLNRNKVALAAGLLLAALAGWTTPFVMETGETAYERYKKGPVAAYLDAQVEEYLEVHEHRAEAWSKVVYASAVLSTLSLGILFWREKAARWFAAGAAALCLASLLAGIWIAESGGPIRRPDFRAAPAAGAQPVPLPHKVEHGHHDED